MDSFIKISKQTLWQVIAKIVTSLSTFLVLGIIARSYGEEGTGTFTLALTYLAIFYLLADFGFNAHILSSFQNLDKVSQSLQFRKLFALRLGWSFLLVLISLLALPFWPFANISFNQAIIYGSLAIIFSSIFVTTNLIFQSKLRYDLSSTAISLGTLFTLGLVYFFAVDNLPLPFLVLAHLLGWMVMGIVGLFLARRYLTNYLPLFDWKFITNLFKDSWPIAATLALNVVYFRVDSFLIATLRSSAEVGIYNIAYSVFQSVLVLPTFIMNSFYPVMLESLNSNTKKFFAQIKVAFALLLGLSISGSIAMWVLSPFIINILTGGGFQGASASLQILSLGFPAYFLSSLLMWLMVAQKKYKLMLAIYAAGLVVNFAANYIYIPQYSFLASSWITVGSEYLILGLQLAFWKFINVKLQK